MQSLLRALFHQWRQEYADMGYFYRIIKQNKKRVHQALQIHCALVNRKGPILFLRRWKTARGKDDRVEIK
jgi:hypothetical protein